MASSPESSGRGLAGPGTPDGSRSPGGSPTTGPGEPTGSSGPAAPDDVVRRYFAAISAQRYAEAWELGGKNLDPSYRSFTAGLETTEHDDVAIVGVDGETVTIELVAYQTDGSTKEFAGTYTVRDGVIVAADVHDLADGTDTCGAEPNPFGYTFCEGDPIYDPAPGFCDYFGCIANFDDGRGYVEQCADGKYSRSGGLPGVCSQHGGARRQLHEGG